MTRARKALMTAAAIIVIVVGLILAAPSIQRAISDPKPRDLPPMVGQTSNHQELIPISDPKPRDLPPIVGQTTDQLLARLQSVLESNAPVVASALQPGLSDAQIAALESQGGFRLSDDLRALYRWHNGTSRKSPIWLTAGQRFVPLDEVVQERALARQKAASGSEVPFWSEVQSWIRILDCGCSEEDYYYDPKRTEAEGAFFRYSVVEDYYLWFPSLRNFLAGLIECYESRAVRVAADGKSLDEDFERTQKIWKRFAKSSW